jgi:hypothetical protein
MASSLSGQGALFARQEAQRQPVSDYDTFLRISVFYMKLCALGGRYGSNVSYCPTRLQLQDMSKLSCIHKEPGTCTHTQ